MNKNEYKQWRLLVKQYINGWHLSDTDKQELLRLNYLIMELSHRIHNDNMLKIL
jgi:hypothetical protein